MQSEKRNMERMVEAVPDSDYQWLFSSLILDIPPDRKLRGRLGLLRHSAHDAIRVDFKLTSAPRHARREKALAPDPAEQQISHR
jgi:hypothetical protein